MDITTSIAVIVAFGSMVLNYIQWHTKRKGVELNTYEQQLKIIQDLQTAKDESYKQALKTKELEISQLKTDIKTLNSKLERNTSRLVTLQNAVNKLIGGSCTNTKCKKRCGYPLEGLQDILDTEIEAE